MSILIDIIYLYKTTNSFVQLIVLKGTHNLVN